jgi:hypothetical protein
MDDVSYRKFYKQVIKQDKRESRIRQLELILTIVTTVAVIFVSLAFLVLGIIKIQDNYYNQNPPSISTPPTYPMPEVYPPEMSTPV